MSADITPTEHRLQGCVCATIDCPCHDARLNAVGERVPREITHTHTHTHQEFDEYCPPDPTLPNTLPMRCQRKLLHWVHST